MASNNKVIITCAVTGAIHTPSMSPYLPVTADEIAEAAIGAAEAGAAIVHLHARDEKTGRPDQSPEAFARFLPRIKQSTNAVVNLTTGGAPYMTVQERVKPAETFKPEVASLNMGSMNFGLFPMLNRFKNFKHDWEPQALENSRDLVFRNTFKDIEFVLRTLGDAGTRFEFECYDTAHLYNLAHFLERGLVKPPLFVQTVFGILGGIGPHPEDVHAHEAHRRPAVRQAVQMVGARRRAQPARRSPRRPPRWAATCASGSRIRCGRARAARDQQRRAGARGAADHRGARPRGRDARRSARNPRAQGRRQGRVLTARIASSPRHRCRLSGRAACASKS